MAEEDIIDAEVVEEIIDSKPVEPEIFPEVPDDEPVAKAPKPEPEPEPKLNYATMTTRQQNKMRKLEVAALKEWYEGGCQGKRPLTPMFDYLSVEEGKKAKAS